MNVLLIYANPLSMQNEAIQWAAPYGLTCVAASLQRGGHEVRLLDLSFSKSIDAAFQRCFRENRPDIVGLSIRNISNDCNPLVSYYPLLIGLIESLKKHCTAEIILGGSGFSLYPREILKGAGLRFGIVGEGEKAFLELLDALERNEAPRDDLPGLVTNADGEIRLNPPEALKSLEDVPSPSFELIDYKRYLKRNCFASVQTKRGCAYKCIYCDYPLLEGRRYRLIPPDTIADRIARMASAGIRKFFFVDSVFSYPTEHALAVCRAVAGRRLKVRWSAYVNPRGVTRELLRAMKEAGCVRLDTSIDTASDKMLKNLQKDFSVAAIREFDEAAHDVGLPVFYMAQLGGPGEDSETLDETLRVLDLLHAAVGYIGLGFRISPHTPLEDVARREGREILRNPAELPMYLSPCLPEGFERVIWDFCISHPRWFSDLDSGYMGWRMLTKIVKSLNLGDPLNYLPIYGRYRKLVHGLFRFRPACL